MITKAADVGRRTRFWQRAWLAGRGRGLGQIRRSRRIACPLSVGERPHIDNWSSAQCFRGPGARMMTPDANTGAAGKQDRENPMKKYAVRISVLGGGLVAVLLAGGASFSFR